LALDDLTATPGAGGVVPRQSKAIIEPGDREATPKSKPISRRERSRKPTPRACEFSK
jgi:hypothetical protein